MSPLDLTRHPPRPPQDALDGERPALIRVLDVRAADDQRHFAALA